MMSPWGMMPLLAVVTEETSVVLATVLVSMILREYHIIWQHSTWDFFFFLFLVCMMDEDTTVTFV